MVQAGELLWEGSREFIESSNISKFMSWLDDERGLTFDDYEALWSWSVAEPEQFWLSIWDYFEIHSVTPYKQVLSCRDMPGAIWFEGARVNYAEHVLRHESNGDPERPVLRHMSELRPLAQMSWIELGASVRKLAQQFRDLGIRPGDCVAAYLPNIPEAVIAMLATTAIGAVWSAAAPEFGSKTVVDRFSQISPKLLLVGDGYRYGGKDFDRSAEIAEIVAALPSVKTVVWLDYLNRDAPAPETKPDVLAWNTLLAGARCRRRRLHFRICLRRAPALDLVFIRYDRPAQANCSRPSRNPARALQISGLSSQSQAWPRDVFLLHHRVDGVEHADVGAAHERRSGSLRRASGVSHT